MSTAAIDLGRFNIASTDRFRVTIEKDGVVWTGIDSATIVFEQPDRQTQFTRSLTPENPDQGVWFYDTTVTDFLVTGNWSANIRVVDGAIVKRYPYPINFSVVDEPN